MKEQDTKHCAAATPGRREFIEAFGVVSLAGFLGQDGDAADEEQRKKQRLDVLAQQLADAKVIVVN